MATCSIIVSLTLAIRLVKNTSIQNDLSMQSVSTSASTTGVISVHRGWKDAGEGDGYCRAQKDGKEYAYS